MARNPSSLKDLEVFAKEKWAKISVKICRNLVIKYTLFGGCDDDETYCM